jgi:glycosyltransferase involved in cell wall biosynthesis
MLSKFLARNGHEVTIITTNFELDPDYVNSLKSCGIKIYDFPALFNLSSFLYSPSMKKWLEKNIDTFDIVHLHDFRSYQNAITANYAISKKVPYLLQAHGDIPPIGKKELKFIFELIWGNSLLKNANKVLALTETETNQYKQKGVDEKRIEIVPNGINLLEIVELPKKGEFRHKFNISKDNKIILSLGRLHKIKGIDFLIDVYSELIKDNIEYELMIVGPDEGALDSLIKQVERLKLKNKVHFLGPIYGKTKYAAYIDSDVYVLPSRFDAFPTTILEAWYCGTPVITTTACEISNYVKNAGYVVNFDIQELKQKIIDVTNSDKKTQIQMTNIGKKMVENLFNWQKITKRLEIVYENIVKETTL